MEVHVKMQILNRLIGHQQIFNLLFNLPCIKSVCTHGQIDVFGAASCTRYPDTSLTIASTPVDNALETAGATEKHVFLNQMASGF